ncbi:unannotated protein [freshwater metagenome]|uniref:Unannotated protein n=1 Tax=freshwater metagenome TaxID=449393 RepID=A0A6J7J6K1_9ZZZZ
MPGRTLGSTAPIMPAGSPVLEDSLTVSGSRHHPVTLAIPAGGAGESGVVVAGPVAGSHPRFTQISEPASVLSGVSTQ